MMTVWFVHHFLNRVWINILSSWCIPHADSVNKEMDWMLGYASINEDMQKFLLLKFVNRY